MDCLEPGAQAPDFSLPSSDGRTVHLRDHRGRHSVVLVFYSKNNTPG
ncbi:MAG: redoxin domain-containing protein [Acidobacteria bacterium]|nr:redoxin domain-containing protein [Acidobacteriota bacterium]